MEPNNKSESLGNIRKYIFKTIKFYDLKNEGFTRIVFLIMLLTSFLSVFEPEDKAMGIILSVASIAVVYFVQVLYLSEYLKELKGVADKSNSIKKIFKSLFAFISFIASIIVVVGYYLFPEKFDYIMAFLPIPFLVVYTMFIFNTCYILDENVSFINSFKESKKLTDNLKRKIFLILISFNILFSLPGFLIFLIAASTNNKLIFTFVTSFMIAIFNLMQQRLIALMFMDLAHKNKEP